jgi:hypothetical protein
MIATIIEDFTLGQWLVLGLLALLVVVFFIAALAPRSQR